MGHPVNSWGKWYSIFPATSHIFPLCPIFAPNSRLFLSAALPWTEVFLITVPFGSILSHSRFSPSQQVGCVRL